MERMPISTGHSTSRFPPVAPAPSLRPCALLSLHDVFGSIPDPRRSNRRHPLAALLGGLLLAFCTGCNTVRHAVVVLRQNKALRRSLGFTHAVSPSQSTYTRLFGKLDAGLFLEALRGWFLALAEQRLAAGRRGEAAVAVDGKTARGTGEHVVYLFIQDYWLLLDLFEAGEKTNEFKAFEEKLSELIERYPFLMIFTMDALYAQHALAGALTHKGKKAIFQIKGNQKETFVVMKRLFDRLPRNSPDEESVEKKWRLHRDPAGLGPQCPG